MTSSLDTAQTDRACGALVGAGAGDALGAGYEFTHPAADLVPDMIGGGLGNGAPGEWTDDTAMTWVVLEAAAGGADLRTPEALDAIARGFRAWYAAGPPDVGSHTAAVLSAAGPDPSGASMTAVSRGIHERTGWTGGNGSLMRTAPVALAHLDDPRSLVEAAMAVSALTHADERAQQACALWCLGIRHAVLTGELDLRGQLPYLGDAADFWAVRVDEAETRPPATFTPNGGAVAALQAAWAAVAQTPVPEPDPCRHLVDALGVAIRIGHDTDTVAAIAGAMLGARWGVSAVPARWRRLLHGYPGRTGRDLEHLAYLAVNRGRTGPYGWPTVDRIDYTDFQDGHHALARHPYDDGVWMSGAVALDDPPAEIDAVVSLCLTGSTQVAPAAEHLTFRLLDKADPRHNPNLDFVLLDAARTISALREEGRVVLLHCVAAHSRTPTVAVTYAMLRGIPRDEALAAVCAALPAASPNAGFLTALERLEQRLRTAG